MFQSLKDELREKKSIHFYVRARPSARNTEAIQLMDDGSIKINLAAPAQAGKANAALINFIAGEFEVNTAHVEIVSGASARMKLIRISILD